MRSPLVSHLARFGSHIALVLAIALAGCANQPPAVAPVLPKPPAPAEVAPSPPPPKPEEPRAVDKPQAQRLAIEAVDLLQNGDEPRARATLEKAASFDPSNELARRLLEDIKADPQKELGSTFFRYTVQRDDSLSKLAQQYMGDRFRFYILAKYNDIANPGRLAAGQVIKIPGKAPATPPPGARAVTRPVEAEAPAAVAEPAAPPAPLVRDDVAALMRKGSDLQASGNLEGAYGAYRDAALRDSSNSEAARQRDAARAALVRFYDREATQAFQRQNLDLAITKWDRILELDPNNQKAKLERERALDLKKRMSEKFGSNDSAK